MFRRALSRRRVTVAVIGSALALAACGGSPQNANAPTGRFHVEVPISTWPATQRMTQHTDLVIVVRNPGPKAVPNPAVTICNVTCGPTTGKWHDPPEGEGTTVLPFAVLNRTEGVANHSKQVWIVDRNPNPTACTRPQHNNSTYSCLSGGPGGSVTVGSNTWALGHPLKPGRTARFDWKVTAVCTGTYKVAWVVAADVFGNAKAVLSNGSVPQGTFTVSISGAPQQSYVDNSGKIVSTNTPAPAPNHQTAPGPPTVPCTA
jgi:hypothetical protein